MSNPTKPPVFYTIGQIIYILSNKNQTVVPAIVSEEDVRKIKTLNGVQEIVNYKLSIGKDKKIVDLNRIDAEVFTSLQDVRTTLLGRLTNFIDNLVKATQKDVFDWYQMGTDISDTSELVDSLGQPTGPKLDPEQIRSSLDNNLPFGNGPSHHAQQNLRTMVGDNGIPDGGPSEIILPNGDRIKVNSPNG